MWGTKAARSASGIFFHRADGANRLLRGFYGVRSALVHGSPLGDEHKKIIFEDMAQFESLVRQILVAGLRQLPSDEDSRKQRLAGWYDVPETVLADEVRRLIGAISSVNVKQGRLDLLGST